MGRWFMDEPCTRAGIRGGIAKIRVNCPHNDE